jgi:hypothetical protein
MTGIDGYDWSVFGANPVPGDPDVVRGIAAQLRDLADDAGIQNRLLQSVASDSEAVWVGPAADRFRPRIGKLPGQLDKLIASYGDAADALDAYWPALRGAQDLAVEALRKAQAAQAAIGQARSELSQADSAAGNARTSYNQASQALSGATNASSAQTAQVASLQASYQAAQSQVSAATGALGAAQGQLAAAHALKDQAVGAASTAAHRAASSLEAASAAGIQNPHSSWLSSAVGAVEGAIGDVGHQVADFASGLYDGVEGPLVMLAKLADPLTAPQELMMLARGLAYGVTHPLAFGKALLDWQDLSSGNIAHWLGQLAPAVVAAFFTGGASEVADGAEGLTALERAGMSADDVASLVASGNEDVAARIIMRGDDPVPGSIYSDGMPQAERDLSSPLSPEDQIAAEQANFAGEASPSELEPGTWLTNVHDSSVSLWGDQLEGESGRSLAWSATPTDLLEMTSSGDYSQSMALLPEWGGRDEVTVLQTLPGDGPMWTGTAAPKTSALTGETFEGGGQQILVNHLSGASAVWTGPAPWTKVPDAGLVLRGLAKLSGAAAGADGTRVLSSQTAGR